LQCKLFLWVEMQLEVKKDKVTNQEKGNDDSDIIQLTRAELKLILEHAGVVLCKNEIRKEKIRLENENFKSKFFNFAPIHIVSLFALSISIISLLLVAINGNGLENTESSKYYSMLFVLGLATIVFLFTLSNIIFYIQSIYNVFNIIKHLWFSLVIGITIGYYYTSVQYELLSHLEAVIDLDYVFVEKNIVLILGALAITGFGLACFLFCILKSFLILRHKKWMFLRLSENLVSLFLSSTSFAYGILAYKSDINFFLNIFSVSVVNMILIIQFDKVMFYRYNEHFKGIYKYMPF
jgi:hypothetical protein